MVKFNSKLDTTLNCISVLSVLWDSGLLIHEGRESRSKRAGMSETPFSETVSGLQLSFIPQQGGKVAAVSVSKFMLEIGQESRLRDNLQISSSPRTQGDYPDKEIPGCKESPPFYTKPRELSRHGGLQTSVQGTTPTHEKRISGFSHWVDLCACL